MSDSVGEPRHDSLQTDDAQLIECIRQGDHRSFDELVRRHQRQVFAVTLRMLGDWAEAEDVAQDVFVRAYRAIGTFRGEAKVTTWLVSIAMNLCRNRRRWWARRRRMIAASLDDPVGEDEEARGHEVADPSPTPDAAAQRREQTQHMTAALQLLHEIDRTVIVLRDIEGCSYEEVAKMLRIPVGTVKSRLNRARFALRALLDGTLD